MSAGDAADLARLRQQYGARWQIDREPGRHVEAASGPGWSTPGAFIASSRTSDRVLRDRSVGGLENQIRTAES